jgi:hypothetical protein
MTELFDRLSPGREMSLRNGDAGGVALRSLIMMCCMMASDSRISRFE